MCLRLVLTPYQTRETHMAKHKGQLVGYVRVSTLDQHTERQLEDEVGEGLH